MKTPTLILFLLVIFLTVSIIVVDAYRENFSQHSYSETKNMYANNLNHKQKNGPKSSPKSPKSPKSHKSHKSPKSPKSHKSHKSHKSNKSNKSHESNSPDRNSILSTPALVEDTITITDTVRKDSKVASSLNYTYLDENCKQIVTKNPFPIQNAEVNYQSPLLPDAHSQNSQNSGNADVATLPNQDNAIQDSDDTQHRQKRNKALQNKKINNSEMFDDSELKPKPEVDSPYGFVFFPNKYWKQWHQKAPVCTPISKCKVLPTYTQGTPVDVLDYTQIGSIMPKFDYREEMDYNSEN